ncbi:MAG: hypothetical protein ICV78_01315 [Tolypothrix sp. Co-bin9]|nr:hypothetical protein [Tolypothrix sp. Co-bin9]
MNTKSKEQLLQLDRSLYREIFEIEASNFRGGAISHELTHVLQQSSIVSSLRK